MRFFRGRGGGVGGLIVITSSSSGVWGRLEDVRDVPDDAEGAGVEPEEPDLTKWGDDGGVGVTENDRCIAGM